MSTPAPRSHAATVPAPATVLAPAPAEPRLARPPELDELDLEVGTVIEASAGTGKTYLLEHLVLELVLTGRARIEEILVVTFTERATAELLARIRAKIDQALACSDDRFKTDAPGGVASDSSSRPGTWRLDGLARQRLFAARASLDRAAISTIHGFCQRILVEEPFSTNRLLHQTQTDGRRLFSELFRDRLRCRFATEPTFVDYLDTYLATVQTAAVERLEELLYRAFAAQQASPEAVIWDSPYDEHALDEVMRTLVALRCDSAPMAVAFKAMSRRRRGHQEKLEEAIQVARRCLDQGRRAPFLAHLDGAGTFVDHLGDLDAVPDDDPERGPLARVARAILDHAPTLDEAVVQTLLPELAQAVAQRKRDEGLFDFDDMITALAEAVEAPGGAGLVGRIRSRYRIALIDEAQDTSPAQWRVFRRCFLDSGGTHPVILVGDPKQAIYGFRGGDVRTFLGAADELVARGGRRTVLSVNHRSYAEVVDAYNAICAAPPTSPDGSSAECEGEGMPHAVELGALLDAGAPAPFFTGGVTYAHPVRSARGALAPGEVAPGITLFKLDFEAKTRRIGHVRAALRAGMVRTILRLWRGAPGPEDRGVSLSEIFVLTRTNGESAEMAEALREAGIPNALYKPDHLFETPEAEHLRRLLAAIADPTDRVARFQAWLTPFFGIPLAELGRVPNPEPGHPALRRLGVWHALAAERRFDLLWPAILHDSGVTRRLRLSPFSQRRLANYRQLIDVLVAEAGQSTRSISDLVALLGSLQARRRQPTGSLAEGRGIQKVETEEPAVQILTIHKAKGLEADHVFVYGALRAGPGAKRKVSVLHRGRERVLVTGLPRRSARAVQIAEEAEEEDQRLMYVALTRARKHVYLPYVSRLDDGDVSPAKVAPEIDREFVERDDEFLKKLTGAYRLVNHRLVHLAASFPAEFERCFRIEPCPVRASVGAVPASPHTVSTSPLPVGGPARTPSGAEGDCLAQLAAWRPSADLLAPTPGTGMSGGPRQAVDVAARRGFEVTSYSRLKQSGGGYVRPVGLGAQVGGAGEAQIRAEDEGEIPGEEATAMSRQPRGGIDAGLFLHALLEKVPLPIGGAPPAPGRLPFAPLSEWSARPDIRELFDVEARRWQRTPEEATEALAMVHAALGQPLALPGPSRPSDAAVAPVEQTAVGAADRIRREVEFVFPLRRGAGQARGPEPGFVRGVLDVLFEHQGRIYLADWKSDRLPDYGAAAIAEHAARNYALQVQLYVLAVLRMLGIAHEAEYEQRFGGWVYVFLRGLVPPSGASAGGATPSDRPDVAGDRGTWIGRPTWREVQVWQDQLPRLLSPMTRATTRGREDGP